MEDKRGIERLRLEIESLEIEKDICCNNWEKTYSDLKKIDDDMAVAKVTFRWSPKT